MDIDYKEKYLKYKHKYQDLTKKHSLVGGSYNCDFVNDDIKSYFHVTLRFNSYVCSNINNFVQTMDISPKNPTLENLVPDYHISLFTICIKQDYLEYLDVKKISGRIFDEMQSLRDATITLRSTNYRDSRYQFAKHSFSIHDKDFLGRLRGITDRLNTFITDINNKYSTELNSALIQVKVSDILHISVNRDEKIRSPDPPTELLINVNEGNKLQDNNNAHIYYYCVYPAMQKDNILGYINSVSTDRRAREARAVSANKESITVFDTRFMFNNDPRQQIDYQSLTSRYQRNEQLVPLPTGIVLPLVNFLMINNKYGYIHRILSDITYFYSMLNIYFALHYKTVTELTEAYRTHGHIVAEIGNPSITSDRKNEIYEICKSLQGKLQTILSHTPIRVYKSKRTDVLNVFVTDFINYLKEYDINDYSIRQFVINNPYKYDNNNQALIDRNIDYATTARTMYKHLKYNMDTINNTHGNVNTVVINMLALEEVVNNIVRPIEEAREAAAAAARAAAAEKEAAERAARAAVKKAEADKAAAEKAAAEKAAAAANPKPKLSKGSVPSVIPLPGQPVVRPKARPATAAKPATVQVLAPRSASASASVLAARPAPAPVPASTSSQPTPPLARQQNAVKRERSPKDTVSLDTVSAGAGRGAGIRPAPAKGGSMKNHEVKSKTKYVLK